MTPLLWLRWQFRRRNTWYFTQCRECSALYTLTTWQQLRARRLCPECRRDAQWAARAEATPLSDMEAAS